MALVNLTGIDAGKWDLLEDGQPPAKGTTVAVPLAELRDAEEAFFAEGARIGALVPTDANHKDLAPLANKLAFVVINFPAFGDGRGFSLAVRLRKDLGFKGEIRASGHTIPDQALFLKRAGFDTVEIPIERKAAFEAAVKRFDAFYQSDFQGQVSVAHLRHAKADEDKDAGRKAS